MHKDPGQRYLDARALADDLDNWRAGRPIAARPTPTHERFYLWVRRQPAVAALLGLCALGLIAFAICALVYESRLRHALDEARDNAETSRQRLVLLSVAEGSRAMDDGDSLTALLHFTEAMRLDAPGGRREQMHRVRIGTVLRESPDLKRLWLHRGRPRIACFSRDGRHLLTGDDRGVAYVWDMADGNATGPALEHPAAVEAAGFSPAGSEVVLGYRDGAVRMSDLAGKRSWSLAGPEGNRRAHRGPITAVAHGGKQILTASADGTARVWNAAAPGSGRLVARHDAAILAADFLPQRQLVATASADHMARLWNSATGQPLSRPLPHPGRVRFVQLSPDGFCLATACADGGVRVWSVQGKLLIGPLHHQGPVARVQFSPDGTRLLSASDDHTARIWNARAGEPMTVPLTHTSGINSASFSADGRWIATASDDNTARVWDAATGNPVSPRLRHTGSVQQALFAPAGPRLLLATTGDEGSVRLWDVMPVRDRLAALPEVPGNTALWPRRGRWLSPNGQVALTAEKDHDVQLRDVRTNAPLGPPLHHGSNVVLADFLPDSWRVVTGSDDNMARIWDSRSGELLGRPLPHRGTVRYISSSASGDLLLTASAANTARVWDTNTGYPLTPLLFLAGPIRSAAFAEDSSRVSVYVSDGRVLTCDLRPETRSLEEIERLAQLLSGSHVDRRHGVLPLAIPRLVELGRDLDGRSE
jgi:WD40 repeat protein